jgi:hypothetical protein
MYIEKHLVENTDWLVVNTDRLVLNTYRSVEYTDHFMVEIMIIW